MRVIPEFPADLRGLPVFYILPGASFWPALLRRVCDREDGCRVVCRLQSRNVASACYVDASGVHSSLEVIKAGGQRALFLVQRERNSGGAQRRFVEELVEFLRSIDCQSLVFLASCPMKYRYHPEQLNLGTCVRRSGQLPGTLQRIPELEDTSSCSREELIARLRGAGARGLARHLAALPAGSEDAFAAPRFLLAYTGLEPSDDGAFAEEPREANSQTFEGASCRPGGDTEGSRLASPFSPSEILSIFKSL